ncbi:membrane protein [Labrys miyagiensis]
METLQTLWTTLSAPESYAWMAWTWQVALFFATIALLLVIFTLLAVFRPETPRRGILAIATTRGDRLFISLLGAAFIHVFWLALAPAEADLWWASIISLLFAVGVFLTV